MKVSLTSSHLIVETKSSGSGGALVLEQTGRDDETVRTWNELESTIPADRLGPNAVTMDIQYDSVRVTEFKFPYPPPAV